MERSGVTGRAGSAILRGGVWIGTMLRGEVVKRVGGPARARVIALFGAVLALNGADTATVGAVAPQLERALHIGNTKIGLLSSIALLVGAVFTIPVGMLVDRAKRMPMLAISIVLWSLASLLSAFAGSYSSLLLTRLVLGAVTATAGPAIASLTGDYFPASERGRVYAYILGGEIAGTAVGFTISGTVASLIDWRAAFVLLAIPGFFLARELWRTVPEPLRGGQSRLQPGVADLDQALAAAVSKAEDPDEPAADEQDLARETVRQRGVEADPRLVLNRDPGEMPLTMAVRYVLLIPTNVMLIIGSSLGYFFLAGLQTFAVLFVRGHYHTSQATATLVLGALVAGAMIGTLASGRITDMMVRRGALEARTWIPAICYLGAAALLVPGVLGSKLTPALWFDVGGAALLSAANPPLDAARLDIMPAGLWGRAESIRTVVRSLAQALAPLVFGALSQLIAGILPEQTPVGTHADVASAASAARGLEITFLIMLSTLAAAGVFLGRASHTYSEDVATAAASQQRLAEAGARHQPAAG
ncbi:MAG: MFS transporter [Solirubrobacterales bacterium]|nr:MFS transporter [Solirubrobacterales bacterium]MBV9713833.1 MFS transporter [Solirubrobacterales bacterium]